jgi:hypothetical protein
LAELTPGPEMAAFLATISKRDLTAADRVYLMQAHQRMVSYYQAELYSDMVAIWQHDQGEDLGEQFAFVVSELRAALRLTRRAAEIELGTAIDLFERTPLLGASLHSGQIDLRRARVFGFGTAHLPDDLRQLVIERTIAVARNLTGGQLQALLRKLCIKADPEEAQRRYESLVSDRRVVAQPDPDGTATLLGLDLPPERVQAAMDYITSLAKSLTGEGDSRTIDQLRADIFLDLLAGHPLAKGAQGKGLVDIHVDLATLAELANDPGDLGGYGPVVADIARQVAESQPEAQWRYVVADTHDGKIVAEGTTRRRPLASQRRQVENRNPRCIFPGCRMPASQCDLDHRKRWVEVKETKTDNLVPLCRHDHWVRHGAGWEHQPLPDGDHLWTSPLGLQYTTSGRLPP